MTKTTHNFNLNIEVSPAEEDDVAQCHPELTSEEVRKIEEDAKHNVWRWCCIKVSRKTDSDSPSLDSEYLGPCSYHSLEEFMASSECGEMVQALADS